MVIKSNSISGKSKGIHIQLDTNEEVVYEYFRCLKSKDIDRLLDLFAEDAIVYEPFSKTGDSAGLQGKTAIEPFLNIAIMANSGLRYQIEFEKSKSEIRYGSNQITAIVTFERGGKLKARFTFKLSPAESNNFQKQKKIQSLYIQFIAENTSVPAVAENVN